MPSSAPQSSPRSILANLYLSSLRNRGVTELTEEHAVELRRLELAGELARATQAAPVITRKAVRS